MRPRGSLISPPLAAPYISLEIIVFVKLNQSLELPRKNRMRNSIYRIAAAWISAPKPEMALKAEAGDGRVLGAFRPSLATL